MKKLLLSLFATIILANAASAQAPQAINYQAAVRNSSGAPLASALVQVRFTIHNGSPTGATLFQETNTVTTTAQGIMNTAIGAGVAVTGTLGAIDWASGTRFLEVELNTGSGYTSIGSQQMVSVPYAFYAAKALMADSASKAGFADSAAKAGNVYWTKSGTAIYNNNTGYVGIRTNSPVAPFTVRDSGRIAALQFIPSGGLGAWQAFYNRNTYIGYLGNYNDTMSLDFGTSGSGQDVNIVTNATTKLTVKNNGKIGIGTTTPSSMFHTQINGIGTYGTGPAWQGTLIVTGTSSAPSASGTYSEGGWRGVLGRNKGISGGTEAIGVQGLVDSSTSYTYGIGVKGEATAAGPQNFGVYGYASGASTSNYGVFGNCATGASNYAAYFNNKIYATSASSSIKSFKIDHPLDPENKYLYHSSVESDDMMNIYNGNVTTSSTGDAVVTLPNYFAALNKDFKYQLTCIGTFAQAIVAEEISGNSFKIKTDKPNVKVSWQVAGVRQDAAANYYRIENEVEKPINEKGFYLIPEAYGKGPEMNFTYPRKGNADNSKN
jgi:hypothetical protein